MEGNIRPARLQDMPAVHALIGELAEFERAPDEFVLTVEQLETDFSAGLFSVLIAEYEGSIAGMALFHPRYSTWKGSGIHLEDLIVSAPYRGKGIGKALLLRVIEEANKAGAARLEWMVLDWNQSAIDLYEGMRATLEKEWVLCRMTDKVLAEYKMNSAK